MNQKKKVRYINILIILGMIILSRTSWRDIPKYYKSLAYVSSINILYYVLCRRHLVWDFTPTDFGLWIVRIIHIGVITPLIVLTYLSNLPKSLMKQVIYTVNCIIVATLFEYFTCKLKLMHYAHSWNVFWSGLIYAKMFVYSYIFNKRPFIALFLSLCSTIFFGLKFKVPIRKKHFSRYFEPLVELYYYTQLDGVFRKMKLIMKFR